MGADVFKITEDPIEPGDLFADVVRAENGAVATFAGVVRNHSGDKQTDHLVYEAYPAMAEKKMAEIGDELKERVGRRGRGDDPPRGEARNRRDQRVDCRR